jgi:hypothetical protein
MKKEYVLITSEVPPKIMNYLKNNKLNFSTFPVFEIKDLSQIPVDKRDFGRDAWQDCDNLIRSEKRGDYETIIFCKAYKSKIDLNQALITNEENESRMKEAKRKGEKIKINKNGMVEHPYIVCKYCLHYSPNSLEGRKRVAEIIAKQYRSLLSDAESDIERIERKIKETEILKAK